MSNDEEILRIRIHEAVKILKDAKLYKDTPTTDCTTGRSWKHAYPGVSPKIEKKNDNFKITNKNRKF